MKQPAPGQGHHLTLASNPSCCISTSRTFWGSPKSTSEPNPPVSAATRMEGYSTLQAQGLRPRVKGSPKQPGWLGPSSCRSSRHSLNHPDIAATKLPALCNVHRTQMDESHQEDLLPPAGCSGGRKKERALLDARGS